MTPRPILRLFQVLVGVLLGLAVVLWWLGRRGDAPPSEGVEEDYFLAAPLQAPTFTLTTQSGDAYDSTAETGKIQVVFFGYTSCPDVCPLTLSKLAAAFSRMGEDGSRIQVLLISVDPRRDTPQRLQAYMENFHPSFLGLTGAEEEIRRVADDFGVYFHANGTSGNYTVDHSARAFVVAPDGKIPLTFPVTATADEMAEDLSTLLGEHLPS